MPTLRWFSGVLVVVFLCILVVGSVGLLFRVIAWAVQGWQLAFGMGGV